MKSVEKASLFYQTLLQINVRRDTNNLRVFEEFRTAQYFRFPDEQRTPSRTDTHQ